MRPVEWRQFGGLQSIFEGLTMNRLSIVLVCLLLGAGSATVTWACLASTRLAVRVLSLVAVMPALVLAGIPLGDVALYIHELQGSSVEPSALPLVLIGLLGSLVVRIAVFVVVAVALVRPSDERIRMVASLAVFAVAVLPVIGYLYVLGHPADAFLLSSQPGGLVNLRAAIASDIILVPVSASFFLVPVWAAVSVGGAAEQAGDFGRRLSARFPKRNMLLVVAVAKLGVDIAGFTGYLPAVLGGSVASWGGGQEIADSGFALEITARFWIVAVVWTTPLLLAVAVAARRRAAANVGLVGWAAALAVVVSASGSLQTLLQWVDTIIPQDFLRLTQQDPLFLDGATNAAIVLLGLVVGSAVVARWSATGALLLVAGFVVALPGQLRVLTETDIGVPNAFMIDLIVCVVAVAVAMNSRLSRWRQPVLIYLAGSTVLLFSQVVSLERPSFIPFGVGLGLLGLWYVLVRGGELRAVTSRDPAAVVLVLAVPALMVSLLWEIAAFGGRYGLDIDGTFSSSAESAFTTVGLPVLALMAATRTSDGVMDET